MRYRAAFLCVCAWLFIPLAGCGEETPLCEGVECKDDGNECTDAVCDPATGTCMHVTAEDNTPCDFEGLPGLCWAGVCVDAALCDDVECEDDGNECTDNACDPATGECVLTTAEDGTACSAGICQEGTCRPACIENLCHCSEMGIRAAVEAGSHDPYTFDCDGPTTVTTKDEIEIDEDVILDGEGNLTVDGNETHRVFWVSSRATVELRGVKVVRGAAREDGGGIDNAGTLTLTDCEVSNNAGRQGGGISNDGTLTLSKTTVSSNSAQGDGGGIWNGGMLTLVDSTVADNTAEHSGGGIENNSGSVELRRCTLSGNTAEDGGGAAIESTGYGGYMPIQLINTTVSGNHPAAGRGAIEVDSGAVIRFSTLQQLPFGDGRYLWVGSGWVEVGNTILHGECAWSDIYSYGGNIESPGDTCGLWGYYEEDWPDVSEEQLALGPLADNGGPTLTHVPGSSSVAIDRIEPWNCVETDQRGVTRPLGPLCDVGSVEGPSLCEGVDCDDLNQCTSDSCDPADATCSYEPVPDYWYCDLGTGGSGGTPGTGGTGGTGGYAPGICYQGECIPNLCAENACDDGNDCTWDHCTLPDGSCWYENVPDGWSCYMGAGGTGGSPGTGGTGGSVPGICAQGECIPDPCWDNPCYDGNDCTWDHCTLPDGSCWYENVPDGRGCYLDGGGAGGVGGAGGTGGTGGSGEWGVCVEGECVPGGEGACTNAADAAVYDALFYIDGRGYELTGPEAAAAIGSDCVFGNFGSPTPSHPGCGPEASAIILCATNPSVECPPEEIDALASCVVTCQQQSIAEFTDGSTLTEECAQCYADSVACSAANCAAAGCTNPNSSTCIACRCEQGCTPAFDICSGLPPSGECG